MGLFRNRSDAGRLLASYLEEFANRTDVIVLALPKGGVPVAAEVASALSAPLDVLVVRKIGAPWNPEYGVGAIASGGMLVLDAEIMNELGLTRASLDPIIRAEQAELLRREQLYRRGRPFPDLQNLVVILVDDGLATGSSMQAAVQAVRTRQPALVVVAVPVASQSAVVELDRLVDRVVCIATREPFISVSAWYWNFDQTTDEEVLAMLEHAGMPQLK